MREDGEDGEDEGLGFGGWLPHLFASMCEKQKKDRLKLAEQQLRRVNSGHDSYVEQAMW